MMKSPSVNEPLWKFRNNAAWPSQIFAFRNLKKTSTTPSCGGPLQAQIFQNFYNQKCEFWPLGPLLPFLKRAPELIKNGNFQKYQFLLFYFVILKLLTKNYVSITKTAAFSPYGPLRAP